MISVILVGAGVALGAAGAAQAALVATAQPKQAGKATRLHWSVDGTTPPISGQIPTSLVVSAPPGFTLNTKAAAKRCTKVLAALNECPRASQIGSGTMTIQVNKPSGPRNLPVPIRLYLGKSNSLLAVAFLAGPRVVPGSISGAHGITITFNPLPTPPVITGISYQFLGVSINLGVTRTIIVKAKSHGHRKRGKGHVRTVRQTISLVRAPATCSGAWMMGATLGLPVGTPASLTAPVACSG